MLLKTITIPVSIIEYFQTRSLNRELYWYFVASSLMQDLGFMKKDQFLIEFAALSSVSERQARRALKRLVDLELLKDLHGTVSIKSKKKICGISKKRIKIDDSFLKDYKTFTSVIIEQQALIVQSRFRYTHKKKRALNKDGRNLSKSNRGKQLTEFVDKADYSRLDLFDVGASLSKISESNNQSLSFNYRYLKNKMNKKFAYLARISKRKFNKIYGSQQILREKDPRFVFSFNSDESININYRIASTYSLSNKLYIK